MPKVPESIDEVKTIECAERQVEMDAIALYGNQQEFPAVAGAYVTEEPDPDQAAPAATTASP